MTGQSYSSGGARSGAHQVTGNDALIVVLDLEHTRDLQ